MKFVKQTNSYSCAPIGIINALRWLGVKATKKKDLARLVKKCKTTKADGTDDGPFFNAVISELEPHADVTHMQDMTLGPLSLLVANGAGVILTVANTFEEHVIFISDISDDWKTFTIANWAWYEEGMNSGFFDNVKKAEEKISSIVLAHYMKETGSDAYVIENTEEVDSWQQFANDWP
jgi:hypothetical protein